MPNELSGGMRKRAGFARALVLDPAIVMFDEPDSGLDPVRTALLCELIREIHAENGGCYMVISHDLGTARRIADFIAVLWSGKIVESGPKEEVFDSTTRSSTSSSTRTSPARCRWTSAMLAPAPVACSRPRSPRGRCAMPARCSSSPRCVAIGAARRGDAVDTDAGLGTLVDKGDPTYRRPSGSRRVRRRTGRRPGQGRPAEAAARQGPAAAAAARGLPLGQGAEGGEAAARRLRRARANRQPVAFLAGPATFLNEAVVQIDAQLDGSRSSCRRTSSSEYLLDGGDQVRDHLAALASTTKNSSPPWSSTSRKARGTPKARLAYLFPNSHAAQIVIRLRPDLSEPNATARSA